MQHWKGTRRRAGCAAITACALSLGKSCRTKGRAASLSDTDLCHSRIRTANQDSSRSAYEPVRLDEKRIRASVVNHLIFHRGLDKIVLSTSKVSVIAWNADKCVVVGRTKVPDSRLNAQERPLQKIKDWLNPWIRAL